MCAAELTATGGLSWEEGSRKEKQAGRHHELSSAVTGLPASTMPHATTAHVHAAACTSPQRPRSTPAHSSPAQELGTISDSQVRSVPFAPPHLVGWCGNAPCVRPRVGHSYHSWPRQPAREDLEAVCCSSDQYVNRTGTVRLLVDNLSEQPCFGPHCFLGLVPSDAVYGVSCCCCRNAI